MSKKANLSAVAHARAAGEKKSSKKKQCRLYVMAGACAFILMISVWFISMMTGGLQIDDPLVTPPATSGDNMPPPTLSTGSEDEVETGTKPMTRKEGFYTFLIIGTDKGGGNTDTIMLCSFDTKEDKLNIMQIPRDSRIITDRKNKKINASYAYGGIEGLKSDIRKLLGLPVDRYAVVSIKAFHKIVDAIGGVEVTVPPGMSYTDPYQNLYIDLKPGKQILNGVEAEGFVRFRSGYADADLGRIKAQKAFMSSFMNKLLSPKTITKIPQLAKIASDNLKTDMALEDIVYLGGQVAELKGESIRFFTLPGEPVGADYGVYKKETLEIINANFNPYTTDIEAGSLDMPSFKRVYGTANGVEGSDLKEALDTTLSKITNKGQSSGSTQQHNEPATVYDPDDAKKDTSSSGTGGSSGIKDNTGSTGGNTGGDTNTIPFPDSDDGNSKPKEPEEEQETSNSNSVRVEIVDTNKDPDLLKKWKNLLTKDGYTVVSATSSGAFLFDTTTIINRNDKNHGRSMIKYAPSADIKNDYIKDSNVDVTLVLGKDLS